MWFNRIVDNLSEIPSAVSFYEKELEQARFETIITGNLEKNAQELSGIMSYRFGQLQEIEAVLEHLNITYKKMRSGFYKKYLERYNRDLSDRAIEKYIDGEDDIVGMATLINELGLVRNRYLAIMKGLEIKHFQIGHIVKLRAVGMEDVNLGSKGG
jgi:hypothetical protein